LKGVILHGGSGTRLRPLTHTGPKQLLKIANKPMSQYALEDLVEAGIKEIAIILGDIYPEKVKEYYGDGSKFNCKITYIYQEKPLGIAHAVQLAREFIGNERFVVYLGDNILESGIKAQVERFENGEEDAMIMLTQSNHPQDFGVAEFDKSNRLVNLIEKPKNPPSNYVLVGIYFFTPLVFDYISNLKPSWRGELEITDALRAMLQDKRKIEYSFVNGWWKDTGTPEDLLLANQRVLDKIDTEFIEEQNVQGRVKVGKNVKIDSTSKVLGPAVIGDNVEIGEGAFIGPYTSIADGSKIYKAEVENSIILDNSLIDVNGRIVNSIIGARSQIVANNNIPKGLRLIVGENSRIEL
jgi:glucose-1-phosphate thymidylyltransferase